MTIPAHLRKKYGINEGSLIYVEDVGDGIKIKVPDWIDREAGTADYIPDELKSKLDEERDTWS